MKKFLLPFLLLASFSNVLFANDKFTYIEVIEMKTPMSSKESYFCYAILNGTLIKNNERNTKRVNSHTGKQERQTYQIYVVPHDCRHYESKLDAFNHLGQYGFKLVCEYKEGDSHHFLMMSKEKVTIKITNDWEHFEYVSINAN
jgi:hypothetical protein